MSEAERDVRNKWEYLERGIISTIVAKTTTIEKGIFFQQICFDGEKDRIEYSDHFPSLIM